MSEQPPVKYWTCSNCNSVHRLIIRKDNNICPICGHVQDDIFGRGIAKDELKKEDT